MPNILIVDDEKEITETLSEYLVSCGHKVSSCSNAIDGLSKLDQEMNYQLVLSDIKMPQMSGIDFFKQYQTKDSHNARFVLMTGHADLINVQTAYSLGVDELLAKPFDLDVLKLVIDYLLETGDLDNSEEKYFSIPIDELMISSNSNHNLFLKINGKYVCVTKTGQEFTHLRLQNFKSKGLKYIYLNAQDYAKYTDLQFAIADSMKIRPIDSAKKTKAFNHLISTVSQNSIMNAIDKDSLTKALHALESYSQVALNNSQMGDMLVSLVNDVPDLADKNSLIATISSCVADLWRWNSPKIQSRIVLGALLCDVGLKESKHLLEKKRLNYTKEELIEFEEHPFKSFKMLSEVGDLPEEVLHIALQHHEDGAGHGFPQKLNRSKVHAFSRLVHGVNSFVETLYLQQDKKDVKHALNQLFTLQRKIVSEQVIKSLYLVFKIEMPKELEGLLLPSQSGRVN